MASCIRSNSGSKSMTGSNYNASILPIAPIVDAKQPTELLELYCLAKKGEFQNYCQVPSTTNSASNPNWEKVNWWLVLKEAGAIDDKVKYTLFYNDLNGKTFTLESQSKIRDVGFKEFIETIDNPKCEIANVKTFQSWFHESSKAKNTKNFDKPSVAKFEHAHAKYLISHDASYNGFIVDHSLPMPYTDAVFGVSKSNPSQHAFCFNFNPAGFQEIINLFRVSRPMIVKTNIHGNCRKDLSPLWDKSHKTSSLTLSYEELDDKADECKTAWQSTMLKFDEIFTKAYPSQCYQRASLSLSIADPNNPKFIDAIAFYPRRQNEDHGCFKNPTSTVNKELKKDVVEPYTWDPFYSKCAEDDKKAIHLARFSGKKEEKYICSPVEYGIDSWLAASQIMGKLLYVSTQNQKSKFPSFVNQKPLWGVYEVNSFFEESDKHEKIGIQHDGDTVCIGDSNRVRGQLHHLGSIFCFDDKKVADYLKELLLAKKEPFNTVNLYGDASGLGPKYQKATVDPTTKSKTRPLSFFYPNDVNNLKGFNPDPLIADTKCGATEELDPADYTDLTVPLFHAEFFFEPKQDEEDKLEGYNPHEEPNKKWDWIKKFAELNAYRSAGKATGRFSGTELNYLNYYIVNLVRFYKQYNRLKESSTAYPSGGTYYKSEKFRKLHRCEGFQPAHLDRIIPPKTIVEDLEEILLDRVEEAMSNNIIVGYNTKCHSKDMIDLTPRTNQVGSCAEPKPTCIDPPNPVNIHRSYAYDESDDEDGDLKSPKRSKTSETSSGSELHKFLPIPGVPPKMDTS
ncbi:hypothetical protein CYY_005442 [Polysphondylium violaceum]|uniref:Uncharacterized protein n=1 Tax=Polysphondylium violaceum TaxID=133409 RepID=A0A8J4UYN5_9MYCE|nr:hypothetical protein CYY_005442 [Polysphondylium violaceum]